MDIKIRPIEIEDDPEIAVIIRNALAEFGANKPGTVFFDKTTDHLTDLFRISGAAYFVATANGILLGGAGIYPTEGLPEGTAELVKMYLRPEFRGIGLGKKLVQHSLAFAAQAGYRSIYLESMPELSKALRLYEKLGFEYLNGPLGNSGHFGCDRWMLKRLGEGGE